MVHKILLPTQCIHLYHLNLWANILTTCKVHLFCHQSLIRLFSPVHLRHYHNCHLNHHINLDQNNHLNHHINLIHNSHLNHYILLDYLILLDHNSLLDHYLMLCQTSVLMLILLTPLLILHVPPRFFSWPLLLKSRRRGF